MKKFRMLGHKPNKVLLITFIILIISGFIFLSSASFDLAKIKYNNPYYYLEHQLLFGFLPGLVFFLIGYFTYYRKWKIFASWLFFINIVLLALVYSSFGVMLNGARRWISLVGFTFQPSEILKVTLILYIATLLTNSKVKRLRGGDTKIFYTFIFMLLITTILIIFQPATTMAIIILSASVIMYIINGIKLKFVVQAVIVITVLILTVIILTPYRFGRILPYWNNIAQKISPSLEIRNFNGIKIDNYQAKRTVISIKSGGFLGVGFGKSTSKYSILPEPIGDSIFAVIAEELGFLGVFYIILLFTIFISQSFKIAIKSHDNYATLVMVGFASELAIQSVIHISANSGLVPYTGIPLPLISFGGTSYMITMFMIGIMLNISRHYSLK